MSSALRRLVPLNSRCSRKCVAPRNPGASSRLPTPTQQPRVTDRTPGTDSVRTRTPPGRTVRRTMAPPACPATVSVVARVSGSGTAATSGVDRDVAVGDGDFARVASTVAGCIARRVIPDDRGQRELAARVDLLELDLDLL